YAQSKLANVLFTRELARRLEGTGVTANCMHPGFVGTNIFNNVRGVGGMIVRLITPFMRTPEKGADTVIWLASSPGVEGITGRYFREREDRQCKEESYDVAIASRLWEVSEQMMRASS